MADTAAAAFCPPAVPAGDDLLAALRTAGAGNADPVRFRFLEALACRIETLQGPARRVLDARLAQAIADCAGRFAQAQDEARATLATARARHPAAADALQQLFERGDFPALQRRIAALDCQIASTPLAGLTAARAQQASGSAIEPGRAAPSELRPVAADELKSLHYFRDTWSKLSIEQQLAEALAQAPENAGPLNSHRLVLRALEQMREVSPDYLGRFMAYVDALLWLEQADGFGVPLRKAQSR